MVNQKLSFQNAEKFCESEFDGNLASITTKSDFNFVKTMLDEFNPGDSAVYIGGIERKSRWTWTSGIEIYEDAK